MKRSIIKITAISVLSLGLLMQSCEKKTDIVATEKTDFSNSTIAQVYIATVGASRNAVYVDGKVVSGSLLTSGSVFPGSTPGFNVSPGLKAFLVRDTLSTSTQLPLSFAENMQFGKSYTVFMYDTINSPKQKTVETNIIIPSDTTARLRFANFVFSKTAVPAVDIYSKRRNLTLFTNVQISDVTNFIPVPSAYNDTFYVRETGTTNLLATLNGLNPQQKRSYTLVFRGRYQSTTGTPIRTLSAFTNY